MDSETMMQNEGALNEDSPNKIAIEPNARKRITMLAEISLIICISALVNGCSGGQQASLQVPSRQIDAVWVPDNGDGTYRNPVLHADYSDPDVIRVGDDFYMVSSSFNCVPGLPILHSIDLVNWKIIGHAIRKLQPVDVFNVPQHGGGVWAPAIRYRRGEFFIYYGDPDFGIFMIKGKDPAGPWEEPFRVKEAKGWIDPCPFWDDDGNAYLIHAFAASRAGINSILVIHRMNPEGTQLLDDGVKVFDGHGRQPTIEGPKLYKRNGYYYIFAPAGGVKRGWQTVLRSKHILGPYEDRIVMRQGRTEINGPHQGAWVELKSGESWFVHFQDKEAFGRVVHLQPMRWRDDWPVIGDDPDSDGTGEPVSTFRKPAIERTGQVATPQASDEFDADSLGMQWQWHGNPDPTWILSSGHEGLLRLHSVPLPAGFKNFWKLPNLLLQKFPAPQFSAVVKLALHARSETGKAGLIVMGTDYAYVSVRKIEERYYTSMTVCLNSDQGKEESEIGREALRSNEVYLRVEVTPAATCRFSFSEDGVRFHRLGDAFSAKPGKWIGAKVGLFCVGGSVTNEAGYADVDWFRVVKR